MNTLRKIVIVLFALIATSSLCVFFSCTDSSLEKYVFAEWYIKSYTENGETKGYYDILDLEQGVMFYDIRLALNEDKTFIFNKFEETFSGTFDYELLSGTDCGKKTGKWKVKLNFENGDIGEGEISIIRYLWGKPEYSADFEIEGGLYSFDCLWDIDHYINMENDVEQDIFNMITCQNRRAAVSYKIKQLVESDDSLRSRQIRFSSPMRSESLEFDLGNIKMEGEHYIYKSSYSDVEYDLNADTVLSVYAYNIDAEYNITPCSQGVHEGACFLTSIIVPKYYNDSLDNERNFAVFYVDKMGNGCELFGSQIFNILADETAFIETQFLSWTPYYEIQRSHKQSIKNTIAEQLFNRILLEYDLPEERKYAVSSSRVFRFSNSEQDFEIEEITCNDRQKPSSFFYSNGKYYCSMNGFNLSSGVEKFEYVALKLTDESHTNDLYINGEKVKTYEHILDCIEFWWIGDSLNQVDTGLIPESEEYVLKSDSQEIRILSDKIFNYNNYFCQILGEKDFSEILADFPVSG